MISPELHKKPLPLDRVQHRALRLRTGVPSHTATAGLNAFFVTAAEFVDAAREYPLLFVRAGADADGTPQVAPVAVFGLKQGQNLLLDGERWMARYMPAVIRAYPFTMGRLPDARYALCIDESWPAFLSPGDDGYDSAQPLFDETGEPTDYLKQVHQFTEQIEVEVERTRVVGQLLMAKKLLQDMRFDATLPDGRKLGVDGFLAVDEKRLAELPDADVLELHRNGLLGLIHAHRLSMGQMRALTERHLAMEAAANAGATAGATATA
jgi:SapC